MLETAFVEYLKDASEPAIGGSWWYWNSSKQKHLSALY